MVILTISVTARSDKRSELLSACSLITDQTNREAGCLGSRLSQNVDNENALTIEETWQQRADLDDHFRSDLFSALMGAVKLLGTHHDIRIEDGSNIEGGEALRKARSVK